MQRHFTVTGFLSHRGRTALHWHRLGMWLPPGGHIEPDEDPLQAVLREVLEETRIRAEVIATAERYEYAAPPQLPVPAAMAVYDIPGDRQLGEAHQHIDLIYFARPADASGLLALPGGAEEAWAWVDVDTLRSGRGLARAEGEPETGIAEDVRELAIAAIEAERAAAGARARL